MLTIVITGVSGHIGKQLATYAIKCGHHIRGLSRTKEQIPSSLLHDPKFNFTPIDSYYNEEALFRACQGADAVICATAIKPELQLEAQLFLLRAADRAGVKKFIANSWSGDYRTLRLGDMESYDPYFAFRAQCKLEAALKPNFIFIGVFAETMFEAYHPSAVKAAVWVSSLNKIQTWGTGDEVFTVTTMRDAAAYTIHIIERDDAVNGGDWRVFSTRTSLREAGKAYERATGEHVELIVRGSVEDLAALEAEERAKGSKLNYWEYLGHTYWLNLINGKLEQGSDDQSGWFPDSCRTSLEEWFRSKHSKAKAS